MCRKSTRLQRSAIDEQLPLQDLTTSCKRSINLVFHENGKFDQIVAHLEGESEHSRPENDGELPVSTVTAAVPHDKSQELTNLRSYACTVKNQAPSLETAVEGQKRVRTGK